MEKRIIKKYPNRRLYDTATSSYITLNDVKHLVLDYVDIQIVDAKTSEDLTRSVLLQIILEEETCGSPIFSHDVLMQFIRFYGNAMQGALGIFLEKNMQLFVQMQKQLVEQNKSIYNASNPFAKGVWPNLMPTGNHSFLQNMMSDYLLQSTGALFDLQSKMQEQAKTIMDSFVQAQGKPTEPEIDPKNQTN